MRLGLLRNILPPTEVMDSPSDANGQELTAERLPAKTWGWLCKTFEILPYSADTIG
jgi:hypothetical protein